MEHLQKAGPLPGSPAWQRSLPLTGSLRWAHDNLPLPSELARQPWAMPTGTSSRCHSPRAKQPRIFVVLTASVKAFVNLQRRGMRAQQRNQTERRAVYERSVQRWAEDTNIPVVFVENSGADLESIRKHVPATRQEFEVLNVAPWGERLPRGLRPDVGRIEAQALITALNSSTLLAARCPHDIVFKITGRYFVRDFETLVRRQCLRGHSVLHHPGRTPLILVQTPSWAHAAAERPRWERETQAMGFAASFAADVLGWAAIPVAPTFQEYVRWQISSESHFGKLVLRVQNATDLKARACHLPPLPVMPVREGSSGKLRESI